MRAPDPAAKLRELISPAARQGLRADPRRRTSTPPSRRAPTCVGFILARESPRARRRCCRVPETMLSRRRLRRRDRRRPTPTSSSSTRARTATARRDGVLLRDGEPVAHVVDLPWEERGSRRTSSARAATEGGSMLAGGLGPENVARGDRGGAAVGGRRALEPRARARESRTTSACARTWRPRGDRRYGDYGGRYVPETLIPALDELEAGWRAARRPTTSFRRELHELGRTYAGRPTPLTLRRAVRARQARST